MIFHKLLDKAIREKYRISFIYEDLSREVEPYHYGLLNGIQQLHSYQIKGDSHSGGLPEWRNFNISKIKNLKISDVHFVERASYNPSNSHYQTIIMQVIYRHS